MAWFVIGVAIESTVGAELSHDDLVEIMYLLMSGSDADDAAAKAIPLVEFGNTDYPNRDGLNVSWRFRGITSVSKWEAPVLQDGNEVGSFFLKRSEATYILDQVERRLNPPESG